MIGPCRSGSSSRSSFGCRFFSMVERSSSIRFCCKRNGRVIRASFPNWHRDDRQKLMWFTGPNGLECHFFCPTIIVLLPFSKQRRIILGDVFVAAYSQLLCCGVNPARRSFDLAEIADGSFVHHHLSLAVGPLGAKLLITKRRSESQRAQNQIHCPAVV